MKKNVTIAKKIKNGTNVNIEKYAMESKLIYGRMFNPKWDYDHQLVPPISSSTTFRLDSAERGAEGFREFGCYRDESQKQPIYIYDRLGEPNKEILEDHLAYAEQGECCVTFASGMAAISAALCFNIKSNEEILSHNTLYGCTFSFITNWLPKFNIKVKFSDLTNLVKVKKNISENTRMIFFESPVNPTLELIDIEEIKKIVEFENKKRKEQNRIHIIVDNTFATPFCQRPLKLGADFVIHSLTKNIGGFGTDIGGAVICQGKFKPQLMLFRKDFGGVLNSKSAWSFLVYGIPTLSLRVKKQQEAAIEIARFLNDYPKIEKVNYPGLQNFKHYELAKKQMVDYDGNFAPGSMIYFIVKGRTPAERQRKGERVINYLAKNAYTITLAVSLGNIRTLIEHPGSMTHSAIPPEIQMRDGLDPGGIRLSIGLEKVDDIINDLHNALKII
jgi:cystathionine beta-lyase/cystathionine gamma-synthase